jgi:hypothetical protein
VLPFLAIYPNHEWVTDNKKKMVVTSDNVICKVAEETRLHFLSEEMARMVKEIYNTDVLSFGRKWFQVMPISTMEFVLLKLEKYEEEYREDN